MVLTSRRRTVALLNPDRVDGLVVIDIAPVTYTVDEPHWKAVVDIITTLQSVNMAPGMSRRDIDMQLQPTITDPALRAFCLTNYDTAKGEWKVHLESIASQLETLAGFDMNPDREYTGDSFFIHGGQSRFVRHKHMDIIANYFPNHMLTTIRGAGHWVSKRKTVSFYYSFLPCWNHKGAFSNLIAVTPFYPLFVRSADFCCLLASFGLSK
jgi:esterase